MGRTSAAIEIAAPLAEVWGFYFTQEQWASWVDGFAAVGTSSGYPQRGGTLQWRSTPAGRGTVSERVLEHEPRRVHRIDFSDAYASGEQTTTFGIGRGAVDDARTNVTVELEYELAEGSLFGPITDPIFVRPQMRRSLMRTLERLRAEIEEQPAAGRPIA
ncbi:MAG: SRPBCC family protein [Solirubrobacterales bacterium]